MTAGVLDRAGVRVSARRVQESAEDLAVAFLADAFRQTLACQWRRRAEAMEWARPRPGDFTGRATRAELAAQDERLAKAAELCRAHADLIEQGTAEDLRAELDLLAAEGVA